MAPLLLELRISVHSVSGHTWNPAPSCPPTAPPGCGPSPLPWIVAASLLLRWTHSPEEYDQNGSQPMSFPCAKPSNGSHLTQCESKDLPVVSRARHQQAPSALGPCFAILPSPSHHPAVASRPSCSSSSKPSPDHRAFAPAVLCARNAASQRRPLLTTHLLTQRSPSQRATPDHSPEKGRPTQVGFVFSSAHVWPPLRKAAPPGRGLLSVLFTAVSQSPEQWEATVGFHK